MSISDFIVLASFTAATLAALDYLLPIALATLYPGSAHAPQAKSQLAQRLARQKELNKPRNAEVANLGAPLGYSLYRKRPITEPPMTDYDTFFGEKVPSHKRLQMLFPDDPVRRTGYRDLVTGKALQYNYKDWACDMESRAEYFGDASRALSHSGLRVTLYEDDLEEHRLDALREKLQSWDCGSIRT